VSVVVAASLALASAGLFAVGSAVQHQAALALPPAATGPVALVLQLARRPGWLLSNLSIIAGVVLHGVALSLGALVVVQPLLVTGLLFAMPISARLHRTRVSRAQWRWAAVTVAGLGAFLALTAGGAGHTQPDLDGMGVVVVAVGVMAVAGLVAALWPGPRLKAALYGITSGTAAGLAAAALKASTGLPGQPGHQLLRSPYPYAALGLGTVAFVLSQVAYRSGPLAASLPALTLSDPVASIAVGVGLFAEQITGGAGTRAAQAAVLLVTVTAVVALARAEATPAPDGQRTQPHPLPFRA